MATKDFDLLQANKVAKTLTHENAELKVSCSKLSDQVSILKEKMESMRCEFVEERKVSYKERQKLLKELNKLKTENTQLWKALKQSKTR